MMMRRRARQGRMSKKLRGGRPNEEDDLCLLYHVDDESEETLQCLK